MKQYLKLMRPHHWIKNLLIFFPLFFSGQLLNIALLTNAFLGFMAFNLLSSTVYIINDIADEKHDRQHTEKCKRPIASGKITKKNAAIFAAFLLVIVFILNYIVFRFSLIPWSLAICYLLLNLGYSFGLKNIPLIDIAILASGFLIRLVFGSVITEILISRWLYLTVVALSFYLSLGKRRNELSKQNGASRTVLKYYNHNFLDKNMYMCLALAITFYSLWTVDTLTVERTSTANLMWTVPLVILICMRYSLNIEGSSNGDPVEVVLKDKLLFGLIIAFFITAIAIIYF